MRTLIRTDCGSSEEEDEDGGGRDGSGSAPDEDPTRSSHCRSACNCTKNTQGGSPNRRGFVYICMWYGFDFWLFRVVCKSSTFYVRIYLFLKYFGDICNIKMSNDMVNEKQVNDVSQTSNVPKGLTKHNDLPWNIRKFLKNQLRGFRFDDLSDIRPWSGNAWSHTDLRRLRKGMVTAQIDVIRRLVNKHPESLVLVTTAEGIERAHKEGKIASLIGVEGGHAIGTSLAVLRMLYELGARYLTLTHTCHTPCLCQMVYVLFNPDPYLRVVSKYRYRGTAIEPGIVRAMIRSHSMAIMRTIVTIELLTCWFVRADCSKADEPGQVPHVGGLSNFGKSIVLEMNRLGMMVDLSHVSVPTMLDAMTSSRAPVIFSHSSAHALCNSSRNVPDHALRHLKQSMYMAPAAVAVAAAVGVGGDSGSGSGSGAAGAEPHNCQFQPRHDAP
ncbi:hypothetical protein M0804_010284 [Polistes exclamans]|nr:hypothetical protein M0804_010284 [Polistes exclamans]